MQKKEKLKELDGKRIVQVLLDDKGDVIGQLGHGGKTTTRKPPQIIEGLKGKKVAKISAGYYHSGALTQDGTITICGVMEVMVQ